MNHWWYFVAAASGILYGVFELINAYPEMKRGALSNLWSITYLICNAAAALIVMMLTKEKLAGALSTIFTNQPISDTVIAVFSGPLTSFCLRHCGAKSGKGKKELLSFQDRIFDFLREEIRRSVRVACAQLSQQVAEKWADRLQELRGMAIDYVNSDNRNPNEKAKQRRYINELVRDRDTRVLIYFLITNYGETWVRNNLL